MRRDCVLLLLLLLLCGPGTIPSLLLLLFPKRSLIAAAICSCSGLIISCQVSFLASIQSGHPNFQLVRKLKYSRCPSPGKPKEEEEGEEGEKILERSKCVKANGRECNKVESMCQGSGEA